MNSISMLNRWFVTLWVAIKRWHFVQALHKETHPQRDMFFERKSCIVFSRPWFRSITCFQLKSFQFVHRKFPENVECLKFLVKISSDLGLKEAGEYALELKKAERARELKESRISSSRSGSRMGSSQRNSRNGSAVSELSFGVHPLRQRHWKLASSLQYSR